VSLSVAAVCAKATAGAPTTEARRALMYAFKYQGAGYSQWNRDSLNPPMFDCSSMIGRAYRAAGAKIKRYSSGEVMNFYPYFGWTGAYTTDAYQAPTRCGLFHADGPRRHHHPVQRLQPGELRG
jgi:cell wall-associated NlpC family hydrolase